MVDFRPYKIGANIPEGMKIPEDKPRDEYATTFIYEKNGVKKEFTLNNYPGNDSTCTNSASNGLTTEKPRSD